MSNIPKQLRDLDAKELHTSINMYTYYTYHTEYV